MLSGCRGCKTTCKYGSLHYRKRNRMVETVHIRAVDCNPLYSYGIMCAQILFTLVDEPSLQMRPARSHEKGLHVICAFHAYQPTMYKTDSYSPTLISFFSPAALYCFRRSLTTRAFVQSCKYHFATTLSLPLHVLSRCSKDSDATTSQVARS